MSDGPTSSGAELLARWQRELQRRLPDEKYVRERNAAITGTYASWYRQKPALFKWAGAAAFASRQVGVALAPFPSTTLIDRFTSAVLDELHIDHHEGLALSHELDLIRETNNLVFRDIGWAHAAYAEDDGGIAAVEAGLADQPRQSRLLAGFREIERGRLLLNDPAGDRTAAEAAVWRGNELLLEHEQSVTVQDQFAKFTRPFTILLDVVTSIDFSPGSAMATLRRISSFAEFMLREFRWSADVTRLADRWYWVKYDVLPLWRLVDASDAELAQRLDRLIAAGGVA